MVNLIEVRESLSQTGHWSALPGAKTSQTVKPFARFSLIPRNCAHGTYGEQLIAMDVFVMALWWETIGHSGRWTTRDGKPSIEHGIQAAWEGRTHAHALTRVPRTPAALDRNHTIITNHDPSRGDISAQSLPNGSGSGLLFSLDAEEKSAASSLAFGDALARYKTALMALRRGRVSLRPSRRPRFTRTPCPLQRTSPRLKTPSSMLPGALHAAPYGLVRRSAECSCVYATLQFRADALATLISRPH